MQGGEYWQSEPSTQCTWNKNKENFTNTVAVMKDHIKSHDENIFLSVSCFRRHIERLVCFFSDEMPNLGHF